MLKTTGILFFSLFALSFQNSQAQDEDRVIHTKDGTTLGWKRDFVAQCKRNYGAPADNQMIIQVCQCQVELLDRRFTQKQIKAYDKKYKERGFEMLMEEDTALQRQIKECNAGVDSLLLLSIPEYRRNFVNKCVDNLKRTSTQPLNDTTTAIFCNCAADVMEKRKITLERYKELADPSSFLYNEIAYRCGSPFLKPADFAPGWKAADSTDISGPIGADSVQIISLMGMHKIKITIGGITKIWLIDSGASDLLISEAYAKELREKGIISEMNYAGEGLYSLADNRVISCKKYKINGLTIGRFVLNNVMLAVAKEAREFLLGKSVLNKFTQWSLDNKHDVLILKR